MNHSRAPELQTTGWLNSPTPMTLAELRGRVVLVEVFQMLCPGCVSHGLPQAVRVSQTFERDDVVVLGLHSVFEHHEAQGTREALSAFLHEYRISFPVGIDAQSAAGGLPKTMSAYEMQGTPTMLLIDRGGYLRKQSFGQQPDLSLGAEIMALVSETQSAVGRRGDESIEGDMCDENGCSMREQST